LGDAEIWKKIDLSKIERPGLSIEESDVMDILEVQKMDKINLRHNFFLMLTDKSNPKADFTVVPLTFVLEFFLGFTTGIGSRFGPQ